jgi:uncharacterized membrane protein ArfC
MDDANWWLIGLAFVLGLLLTFVLTIRRVKREVPVSSSTRTAAVGGAAGADTAESEAEKSESESESETNEDTCGD